jgi:hypothetical protein
MAPMIHPMHPRSSTAAGIQRRTPGRRGNSMVLVAGLLVLLVIIVAAFLSSSRGTRELAAAQRERSLRSASVNDVAEQLADEIAGALFARPIDSVGIGNPAELPNPADRDLAFEQLRDGNRPRLEPLPDSRRYGTDWDADGDGRPEVTWNTAPYHVVPWTNWPDNLSLLYPPGEERRWPAGPGFPGNDPNPAIPALRPELTEGNPLGDPGTGDSRWLADAEPMRWDIIPGTNANGGVDGFPHAFRMWRHMSYIGRPENGWRVVGDISNVTGNLVTNLRYPVEQWLTDVVPSPFFDPDTGFARWDFNAANPDLGPSYQRWQDWFFQYPVVYADPNRIPHNFFRLDDADADGSYDPPGDTFRVGTPRWDLNRVLDDADGDGFTDSFWWLAPIQGSDGVRYVVSFRIVDNAAKANANVATRFEPGRTTNPLDDLATKGETPADLALVGRPGLAALDPLPLLSDFNVGLLDNPLRRDTSGILLRRGANFASQMYDGSNVSDVAWGGNTNAAAISQWRDFTGELRVPITPLDDAFRFANDRRLWFNVAGSRPFDAGFGITPFGLEDELELRMFHGNNFTWTLSRFERALNKPFNLTQDPTGQILRSSRNYQESSGFLNPSENFKVDAYELAHDTRHRLTLFNGARNDLKPAWLRWRGALPDRVYRLTRTLPNADRLLEISRFEAQAARKMDLRENDAGRVLRGTAVSTDFVPRGFGERFLHERLAEEIFLALVETDRSGELRPGQQANFESIFGTGIVSSDNEDLARVQRVAAALAANTLSRRDDDRDRMEENADLRFNVAPLYDEVRTTGQAGAIPMPAWPDNFTLNPATVPPLQETTFDVDRDRRMLGMEPQPFLTEAMLCLVYGGSDLPTPPATFLPFVDLDGVGGGGGGDTFVIASPGNGGGEQGTAVLTLQMANPFDHVIPWQELRKYGLRLFDREIDFQTIFNAAGFTTGWDFFPSADDNPVTLTIVIADPTYTYQENRRFNGDAAGPPTTIGDFRNQWLRFMGLQASAPGAVGSDESITIVIPWSVIPGLDGLPAEFYQDDDGGGGPGGPGGDGTAEDALIELYRRTFHDRADVIADSENVPPFPAGSLPPGDPQLESLVVVDRFGQPGSRLRADLAELEEPPAFDVDLVPATSGGSNSDWAGVRIRKPILMMPVSVRRAWSRDLDANTGPGVLELDNIGFSPREHAPRYVMGRERSFGPPEYREAIPLAEQTNPDIPFRRKAGFPGDNGDPVVYRGWEVDLEGGTDASDTPLPVAASTASEFDEVWFWEIIPHPYQFQDDTSLPEGPNTFIGRRPVYFDGARDPLFVDLNFLLTAAREGAGAVGGTVSPENERLLARGLWKGEFGPTDTAFQMLQKEGDFQHVGEMLLVFGVGHELEFRNNLYEGTIRTFSEAIVDDEVSPADRGPFIGRLVGGRIIGDAPDQARFDSEDRRHSVPELAAGHRLLASFVCDGPGVNWDPSIPGSPGYDQVAFGNAAGFTGRITPGMVNINTASPEVLAALPHWTTMMHFDEDRFAATSALPHAVLAYRERYDNFTRAPVTGLASHGVPGGPDYTDRPNDGRRERGFADIGEMLQMDREGNFTFPQPGAPSLRGQVLNAITTPELVEQRLRSIRYEPDSWRISWAGRAPLRSGGVDVDAFYGTRLGIDVNQPQRDLLRPDGDPNNVDEFLRQEGDPAAGDAEERRMLFGGVSNIVTTTSDMFTVYFRVRAFRPRSDGVLDATDPTAVLSDRRYVMLVDRSNVNTPTDRPQILYLQEVPD